MGFLRNKYYKCIRSFLWFSQEHFLFSRLLYCKNTIYNTYNVQNMCWSTVYVIGKASRQQLAIISEVLGKSKLYMDFQLHRGPASITSEIFKGQV